MPNVPLLICPPPSLPLPSHARKAAALASLSGPSWQLWHFCPEVQGGGEVWVPWHQAEMLSLFPAGGEAHTNSLPSPQLPGLSFLLPEGTVPPLHQI